ncbi:MAG: dephospho-CoA kinase [Clostridiales bacterium]|jgi:dephospho-CoA kinase|nr:dephospho-CoA kinase [Clostridiales bacterium]
MVLIGITGSSGSGKSALAGILARRGVHVIDADKIAHGIIAEGTPCFAEVVAEFGVAKRSALAGIVFNDPIKLEKLNEITHKYILQEIQNELQEVGRDASVKFVAIEAIALFESGLADDCDYTIAVLADDDIRIERIVRRDNVSVIQAKERLDAQEKDEFYTSRADLTIINNSDIENLTKAGDEVLNFLN